MVVLSPSLYEVLARRYGGSSMAPSRFLAKKRKKSKIRVWLLLVSLPLFILVLIELYKWLIPFNTVNPLWRDATVGETVIGDWKYEGYDEEGYLKFYNHGQTHLLPPTSHLLALDGQFVVVEESSPNSITFAPKLYQAIPFHWILSMFGFLLLVLLGGYWYVRRRLHAHHKRLVDLLSRQRGFRPRKRN